MLRTIWHLKDSLGKTHRATTQEEFQHTLCVIRAKNGEDSEIEVFATIEDVRVSQQTTAFQSPAFMNVA